MKKEIRELVVIGAGGNGREIAWIAERINALENKWKSISFVDDNPKLAGTVINNHPVLGNISYLINKQNPIDVVCSIASPKLREEIINQISDNSNINFPVIIDPTAIVSEKNNFGEGSVIGINTSITVNSNIGRFALINNGCTIGHDFDCKDYVSVYPGVNIAGNVTLNSKVQIGTGAKIIQGISICKGSYIGAGAVVIKDISVLGTYVGIPAERLEK